MSSVCVITPPYGLRSFEERLNVSYKNTPKIFLDMSPMCFFPGLLPNQNRVAEQLQGSQDKNVYSLDHLYDTTVVMCSVRSCSIILSVIFFETVLKNQSVADVCIRNKRSRNSNIARSNKCQEVSLIRIDRILFFCRLVFLFF